MGEVGADTDRDHYRDQRVNPGVVRFTLDHAREAGLSAVLAHSADENVYPKDRSGLTATGRVMADFKA